jgi:hypothetical protein
MSDDAAGGQDVPVGAAFSLGWLMAQLFGPVPVRQGPDGNAHLPTINELDADSYVTIAFLELERLLAPFPGLSDADLVAAWKADGHDGFTAAVHALHLEILQQLSNRNQQLSAYQLGRALSDGCWLPDEKAGGEFVQQEFDRDRMATLQSWLAEASAVLPPQSAAIVSRSLQNWQDWPARLGQRGDHQVVGVAEQVGHHVVGQRAVQRDRVPVPLVQVVAGRDGGIGGAQLDRELGVALDAQLQRLAVEVAGREHLPLDLEDRHLVPERELLPGAGKRQALRLELVFVHDVPPRNVGPASVADATACGRCHTRL